MALTTTTANGAISASGQLVTLTAYTAPGGRPKALLKVDDEIMLIVDTTNSPTLAVVRGYMGTQAVSHTTQAAAVYGSPIDFQTSKGPSFVAPSIVNAAMLQNAQEVTATGATGSTAAAITQFSPAYLSVTGTSGAGINLPVPSAGASYVIWNGMTGALKIYSVGATVNGVTGVTGATLTSTGNTLALAQCSTAGAWRVFGNT